MPFRQELLWGWGIIMLSFILGGVGLSLLRSEVHSQASRVVDLKTQAAERSVVGIDIASLQGQAETAKPIAEKIANLLPPKDRLINFPAYLQNLANQRHVEARFSFEGGEVAPGDATPGSVGFSIDILGPLVGIEGLLEDLEVAPRAYFLKLNDFQLHQTGEAYRLTGRGQLFFQ